MLLVGLVAGGAQSVQAQVAPERSVDLATKSFLHADLGGEDVFVAPGQLQTRAAAEVQGRLNALGVGPWAAHLDARSGRFASLLTATPLIPGDGVGNRLRWSDLGAAEPDSVSAQEQAAWEAFYAYLEANKDTLKVDPAELTATPVLTSQDGGDTIQIYAPRQIDGIDVRGNYVSAVIKKGNLILFGAYKWSDRGTQSKRPQISADLARAAAESYLAPFAVSREWGKPELVYLAMANGNAPDHSNGYRYQPAWAVKVNVAGDGGNWEVLVDAYTGEILANEDRNVYAEVKGGVFPVTNDGVVPDGVEQPGWPMPFASITTTSGTIVTDTGGNVAATGSMTSNLSGQYVRMVDNCGSISLTQVDGIDFGTSGGTDCATPGFGGAGNTHASRSGFYEINRIKEMARGQLPSNSWLQQQLTSNMNINNTCNAFWNGSTVNFYRSGGGCANTGEIAGVFDHEWGHGMDDNDAVPTIASPSGEGIADVYAALRLNDSCIGRNFLPSACGGYGDPCLTCTGVRDIDYLKRQSGQPHTYTWSNANCSSVHCIGAVYSEAVWSLWKRKLQAPPFNYDDNTAHEIVTRLTYIGAGNTGTWFSGGPPNGGCGASSGYMNYLAADDDNGNLNDGTPHMTAIYAAFNDQQIACQTPTVQNSGCAGTPTAAPVVSTSAGNQLVSLSWGAVAGASSYDVFRTEGVFQCDFGKVKVGSTAGTSFNDSGLQNGREYSYVVIPKGPAASCFGPASDCATDSPVGQPDFAVSCSPASHSIQQGAGAQSTCTVLSSFGYTGNVGLSCAGNPAGIGCSFAPSSVSPPADGSANSTLAIDVDLAQAVGTFNFDVVGDDGATTRTSAMNVTVTPEGQNGPQNAVWNATYQAPACLVPGSSCDSTSLVESRDNLSPSEPNQPNTISGSCADGTSGTYHSDESNDRIVVRTLDGFDFAEGATVEVEATVWAWSTGSSDALDLYYAADATNPSWVFIGTIVPPSGGTHALTAQYTLPNGTLQAVRAQFRYVGSASPCTSGSYNDRDDLVFAVNAPVQCTVDADCDDGAFCNGDETCNAGTCETGTPPVCDDGAFCNGTETCNETTDSCDAGTPPACDDGQYCNGAESCNESTDSCDAGTPPVCDDGLFCNGAESCNEGTDSCDPGTAVDCADGVSCTDDTCNEATDSCDHVANDAHCDNGAFCDGAETCDPVLDCQPGSDPCPGQSCDEGADVCVACIVDADCSNGLFCDGAETCNAGVCQAGTPPACDDGLFCNGVESCNEGTDSCDAGTPPACDDGLFCNGAESCNEGTDSCDAGTPPACDDGAFCNGTETCNEGTDSCDAGTPPCTGGQTCNETTDICEGGVSPKIWMSFKTDASVPGVGTVADEDIVSYDQGSGLWQLEFDGSDVGLASFEIDGMARLPGGDLLLSFTGAGTVGGLSVDDSDIVRFTPTSMGSNTAGSFSFYFDGSDVGLTNSGEDVDAIALAADGRLIVSTTGGFNANGASGADEDLFIFTGTLGPATSGSFALYFDGSDVGLNNSSSEDVDAATLTASGNLLFATLGNFSVTGVSGANEDVAEFAGTFGSATSGSFSMRLDLSTLGISTTEAIGSLHIVE